MDGRRRTVRRPRRSAVELAALAEQAAPEIVAMPE
jgi:hypothetical protein